MDEKNYYDAIALGYDELHGEEQLTKLNLIKNNLQDNFLTKDSIILDVGCGSGISTRFWNCNRTGIDLSKELIKIAEKKDKLGTYTVESAENISFKERTFDVVISLTAIQNFRDINKGLNEIKRVGQNKFILTVLKKAPNFIKIKELILELFNVKQIIVEEKDEIFLIF